MATRQKQDRFDFTLSLRLRTVSVREDQQLPHLFGSIVEADPLPDEFLRFGVEFADGRRATNLDRPPYDPEGQQPDPPVLNQHGGGGGGSAWDIEHWVWPLPPAGPFAFVCEWPGRAIAESRVEVDAGLILEAAGRAVTLWPEGLFGRSMLGPHDIGNRRDLAGTSGHDRHEEPAGHCASMPSTSAIGTG